MFDLFEAAWELPDSDLRVVEAKKFARTVAKLGEPLKFGVRSQDQETLKSLVEPLGFEVILDLFNDKIVKRFPGNKNRELLEQVE